MTGPLSQLKAQRKARGAVIVECNRILQSLLWLSSAERAAVEYAARVVVACRSREARPTPPNILMTAAEVRAVGDDVQRKNTRGYAAYNLFKLVEAYPWLEEVEKQALEWAAQVLIAVRDHQVPPAKPGGTQWSIARRAAAGQATKAERARRKAAAKQARKTQLEDAGARSVDYNKKATPATEAAAESKATAKPKPKTQPKPKAKLKLVPTVKAGSGKVPAEVLENLLSTADAAKRAGVTPQTVSNWKYAGFITKLPGGVVWMPEVWAAQQRRFDTTRQVVPAEGRELRDVMRYLRHHGWTPPMVQAHTSVSMGTARKLLTDPHACDVAIMATYVAIVEHAAWAKQRAAENSLRRALEPADRALRGTVNSYIAQAMEQRMPVDVVFRALWAFRAPALGWSYLSREKLDTLAVLIRDHPDHPNRWLGSRRVTVTEAAA